MIQELMIFFDVDGTLISSSNHSLPHKTLLALQELKFAGYKLGIATGRSKQSLIDTGILDQFSFDGFVLNNGQSVYDQHLHLIYEDYFPQDTVEQVIALSKRLDIPLVLKGPKRIITQPANKDVYCARDFLNNSIPPIGIYQGEKIGAMVAYGPMGYDYCDYQTIPGISVIPGMSSYCDLTLPNASKRTGIDILCNLYGCLDYIGFGDSLNDLEMLAHAAVGIAMGNGHEKVKEIASHVTDAIDANGIYNACVHLKLF